MTHINSFVIVICLTAIPANAQEKKPTGIQSKLEALGHKVTLRDFGGFTQHNFKVNNVNCMIVSPEDSVKNSPWIWRARFWGHQPQFDRAMLEQGWHVCYCDVGGLFGADSAVERWNKFYTLSQKLGLHSKPFLEGMSRGGLIIMRWASSNPDQVAGIYADNAVFDMRSWPGGKGTGKGGGGAWQQCLKAYGLDEEQAEDFKDGPLDRLEPLAKGKVPIFVLINEADNVVPPAENGDLLVRRYKKLGGPIEEMRRPDLGHHPHSLKDPTPLVEFALKSINKK